MSEEASPDGTRKGPTCRIPIAKGNYRKLVADFRRHIETALQARDDGINIAAAHEVALACEAIRQAARCGRIMARAGEPGRVTITTTTKTTGEKTTTTTEQTGLSHEQWQSYADRCLRYREAAGKAMDRLKLGVDTKADLWAALDELPAISHDSPPAGPSEAPPGESTMEGDSARPA